MIEINPQVKISNLIEFMNVVMEEFSYITPNSFYEREKVFFRGQSNIKYSLLPSIARPINNNVSYLMFEDQMIQTAKLQNPEEFSGIVYPVNMLAKMQHYGLPTRMLDVTENALIALYFACKSNKNTYDADGEVYCFKVDEKQVHSAYSVYANIAASISNQSELPINIETFMSRIRYESFFPRHEREKSIAQITKHTVSTLSQPIFILPEMLSEREKRQQAAFLLFPNKIDTLELDDDKKTKYYFSREIYDIKKTKRPQINKIITIDANFKKRILSELELFGISEQFIFPETERKCNAIKNQVEYNVLNELR